MASVFDLIAGTYVTIYNRAADPQGANFWATTLGFANINVAAGAQANLAMADTLGQNFYQASSTIFNNTYPTTDSNSVFITKIYNNLGGSDPDGGGLNYWTDRVATLSLTHSVEVARAMTATEIALVLENYIPNPDDTAATLRAQTFQNKIAVSKAVASTNNASFNPASQSLTDPAYLGETNVLVGVTNTEASKSVALSQVQAANAASNPALMVGQNPPLTLTTGIDSPTEGFTDGHGATATVAGAVFKANPTGGVLGLNNTLNTGDNLQATGDAAGHSTLEFTAVLATAGLLANPGFATGVTMSGVDTLNASNQSNLLGIGALPSGFQGNVTGLLTVNDNNSIAGLQLGNSGQGLNTALKNVNINHFAGNPLVTGLGVFPVFAADIAQAASSATNELTVTLNGNLGQTNLVPGVTGGAAIISISSDGPQGTAAAPNLSYGTQTYDTTTNTQTYLQLEAQPGGFLGAIVLTPSVDGTTKFVFKGAGTLAVGQDVAGDHQLVQDINASGTTGHVVITGASSGYGPSSKGGGIIQSAFESTPNPGALYGSAAGFLDNTGTGGKFALTSFELGSGTTFLDASSASVAQIKALTTTPGALVALDNEIVVKDAVATTTSVDTFANIKGFSILGIGGSAAADGAGGTINMANLAAAGFNTIDYVNPAKAAVTINNQTAALTVNTYDNGAGLNLTVGTKGPASGLSDTFTLKVGDALHNDGTGTFGGNGAGFVGDVTLIGDEIVNIAATGQTGLGPVITDTIGYVKLTPTTFAHEQVNISGDTNLTIGVAGGIGKGAIASVDGAGALLQNNLGITITNTGVTTFNDAAAKGVALHFIPTGNSNGLAYDFTTNAEVIDASTSGGLIMQAGDANYSTSSSLGDLITGSATAANALAGSLGNDTITAIFGGDTIATNGGGDKINIAGHSGSDFIDVYGVTSNLIVPVVPGVDYLSLFTGANGSITASNGFAQVGWWGIATSGAAAQVTDGTVTSADLSTVTGFAGGAGGDNLSFSANAWGAGVGGYLGLVGGNMAREAAGGSGGILDIQTAGPGITALAAGTDVIALGQTFTNLTAVKSFFDGPFTGVTFSAALGGGGRADVLVAWEDTNHNTHISDLRMHNAGFLGTTFTGFMANSISDVVELTGVSITDISNANLHLLA
ncbi:MAG: DUF4214 domain-containing protein [Methylocystis silviterrae]